MEPVTIIVDARDHFLTTERCLDTLYANTPQPIDVLVVMGGVPEHLKARWQRQYAGRARFIFTPHFLNQGESRNLGLAEAKTRLAIVMDNDNYVRPGWLEALVRCQQETGATMVVPLILEAPQRIHTAGNDLYISYERGRAYGHKHLRYFKMFYGERANLKRAPTDYAEMHCQLVEVEPALRLGAFDGRLREIHEVDSGLTWAKAGLSMWFEPASVVHFDLGHRLAAEDIRFFIWRWEFRAIQDSYDYFQQKWGLDITEHGTFRNWLFQYNSYLGWLPRTWPSAWALQLDRWIGAVREQVVDWCLFPKYRFIEYKKRRMGYYNWGLERGE